MSLFGLIPSNLLSCREMVLWLTYALETFWSPLTSASARMLLRYVLALKCGAFALGALQLRSGYPPAVASSGMGRQTFWFMRHVNSSALACPVPEGGGGYAHAGAARVVARAQ